MSDKKPVKELRAKAFADIRAKNQARLEQALTPDGLDLLHNPAGPLPSIARPTERVGPAADEWAEAAELADWQQRKVAEFWGKLDYWKLEEAVVLVLGGDPRRKETNPLVDLVGLRVADLRELAVRASDCGHFLNDRFDIVMPSVFIAWAARKGYPAPADLVRVVEAQGKPMIDVKGMVDGLHASLDTMVQQRDMLLEDRDKLADISKRLIGERDELRRKNAELQGAVAQRDSLRVENAQLQARLAEIESRAWEGFDEDGDTYPPELDIAMQAWRAVTNGGGDASLNPKAQIVDWIAKHYPKLSPEAATRLGIVCNWEKSGGRRRRNKE